MHSIEIKGLYEDIIGQVMKYRKWIWKTAAEENDLG